MVREQVEVAVPLIHITRTTQGFERAERAGDPTDDGVASLVIVINELFTTWQTPQLLNSILFVDSAVSWSVHPPVMVIFIASGFGAHFFSALVKAEFELVHFRLSYSNSSAFLLLNKYFLLLLTLLALLLLRLTMVWTGIRHLFLFLQ